MGISVQYKHIVKHDLDCIKGRGGEGKRTLRQLLVLPRQHLRLGDQGRCYAVDGDTCSSVAGCEPVDQAVEGGFRGPISAGDSSSVVS